MFCVKTGPSCAPTPTSPSTAPASSPLGQHNRFASSSSVPSSLPSLRTKISLARTKAPTSATTPQPRPPNLEASHGKGERRSRSRMRQQQHLRLPRQHLSRLAHRGHPYLLGEAGHGFCHALRWQLDTTSPRQGGHALSRSRAKGHDHGNQRPRRSRAGVPWGKAESRYSRRHIAGEGPGKQVEC